MPVTKDTFRAEQKKMCKSGAPNKVGIYGCYCCRKPSFLNHFKKHSRDVAKTRFNRSTKDEIAQALAEMPAERADQEQIAYGEDYEYDPRDYQLPGDYYEDPAYSLAIIREDDAYDAGSYDDRGSYDFDEDY